MIAGRLCVRPAYKIAYIFVSKKFLIIKMI